ADASVGRVFCVYALHRFLHVQAFLTECRRVLLSRGGFLTIGLDPSGGGDRWWIYDYFPTALHADRARYPSTAAIRNALTAAGFREPTSEVAQHIPAQMAFDVALERGVLDRTA